MTTAARSAPQTTLPHCPKCNGRLHVQRDGAESYVRCYNCGRIVTNQDFTAPAPSGDPPETAPPAETGANTPEAELSLLRWPQGVRCPYCPSSRTEPVPGTETPAHICLRCGRVFNVQTGTVMADSDAPPELWVKALQLLQDGQPVTPEQTDPGRQHPARHSDAICKILNRAIQDGAPTVREALVHTPQPATQPAEAKATPDRPPQPGKPAWPAPAETAAGKAPENTATATHDILVALRWTEGIQCPKCSSRNITRNSPSFKKALHCEECPYNFAARTNTLAHNTTITDDQLLSIIRSCEGIRPTKELLEERAGLSQAKATSACLRMEQAIRLWNRQHGQERTGLTAGEYLAVEYVWQTDLGNAKAQSQPAAKTPPEPAASAAAVPGAPQPAAPAILESRETAPTAELVAAVNRLADRVASLEQSIQAMTAPACPICRSGSVQPSVIPSFRQCPACQCHFPEAAGSAATSPCIVLPTGDAGHKAAVTVTMHQ